jgi:hypothetical protein
MPDPEASRIERILDSEYGLRTVLHAERVASDSGGRLFHRRLYRMLLKQQVYVVEPQMIRDIRHVGDYVRHLEATGDEERVASLIGMADLPQMVAAADNFFARLREEVTPELDPGALTPVADLAEGYRVVELTTRAQLETEGKLMQHCVGSYYPDVEAGRCRILSLRDRRNGPHCTMEVVGTEITQFQGKQNQAPAPQYRPYLKEFLLGTELLARPWMLREVGLIRVAERIYGYDDLPDEVDVDGSLSLSFLPLTRLPRRLHVSGDLTLTYASFPALPDDLVVGGDLLLADSSARELPPGLKVGGRLVLEGLPGLVLPDPFEIEGDLVINETPIDLPSTLRTGGRLHLQRSPLRSLPPNLSVGLTLNLRESAVTSLPEGLHVGGDLDLSDTSIDGLPPGLVVGGTLSCSSARFSSLPGDLRVGESLALQFGPFRTVPASITVGDRLDLKGCPLESLPEGLTVGGRLVLTGTPLTRLPARLRVGTYLDITNTPITELPDDLVAYGVRIGEREMSVDEAREFLRSGHAED